MRTSLILLLYFLRSASGLHAAQETADGCTSPDSKHEVIMQGDEGTSDYDLIIRETSVDHTVLFSRTTGGWGTFAAATMPMNFKCLWSPDSMLVAICERETKRSGNTVVYSVVKTATQEIAVPNLMPKIKPHLTADIRGYWLRPEVWLPGHRLILSVEGTQENEERGNFRFLLTLRFVANHSGKVMARIVSFEQDRSIPFSVR